MGKTFDEALQDPGFAERAARWRRSSPQMKALQACAKAALAEASLKPSPAPAPVPQPARLVSSRTRTPPPPAPPPAWEGLAGLLVQRFLRWRRPLGAAVAAAVVLPRLCALLVALCLARFWDVLGHVLVHLAALLVARLQQLADVSWNSISGLDAWAEAAVFARPSAPLPAPQGQAPALLLNLSAVPESSNITVHLHVDGPLYPAQPAPGLPWSSLLLHVLWPIAYRFRHRLFPTA